MTQEFDSLDAWLAWQETLHPRAVDLGLERVRQVAARMQLLQSDARVVTVAGTNGKGSCVATLEALLLNHGAAVGAFTSPHLQRYNERIRVDGREVDDRRLCDAFARIDIARQQLSLTYFEFSTLAALDIFRRSGVDVILLEVGLGGRLDAVNIIDADVAIVTSISRDHEQWLGDELQQIGREKAGIFRSGRWAVCADSDAPASVAAEARRVNANWLQIGEQWQFVEDGVVEDGVVENGVVLDNDRRSWSWRGPDSKGRLRQLSGLNLPRLPLPSVAAALQAFILLGYPLNDELNAVLSHLQLPGRAQLIERYGVSIVLDVAHNPAAARYLAQHLPTLAEDAQTYCVSAIMADKDRLEIFRALVPVVDHWHVCQLPGNNRAATVMQLAQDLRQLRLPAQQHVSVAQGLSQVLREARPGDRVLVMGSFFTVAAAQTYLATGSDRNG